MLKKLNVLLNVIEFIFSIMMCLYVCCPLFLDRNILISYSYVYMGLGIFSEIVVASIELFLFLMLQKKYRFFYVLFMLVELILMLIVNKKIPFLGIGVIVLGSFIKNSIRIICLDEIYSKNGIYDFCEKFNIYIKMPRKRVVKYNKKIVYSAANSKKSNKTKASRSYA